MYTICRVQLGVFVRSYSKKSRIFLIEVELNTNHSIKVSLDNIESVLTDDATAEAVGNGRFLLNHDWLLFLKCSSHRGNSRTFHALVKKLSEKLKSF